MKFVSVTKPGIIFGNIITVLGGFFLASQAGINLWLLLITIVSMALIIACGCILNNYIDRDIDSLMERTKNRVLVKGLISGKIALLYAAILGIAGFFLIYWGTNLLTLFLAFIGLFFYVVVYSLHFKRKSSFGIVIGGVAGAVPPCVGYCAVTGRFDTGAILLFLILFFWQMPHFYAIAIYRLKDFNMAATPVLPAKKTLLYTKITMLAFIGLFVLASLTPTIFGYTGSIYFASAFCLGLIWFFLGLEGLRTKNDIKWARKMFIYSLINITLLSIMMITRQ